MKSAMGILLVGLSLALTGCGTKKGFERPGFAYGCPVGKAKIGAMEDLIEAKVETAGKIPHVEVSELKCTMRNDLLRIEVDLANKSDDVRRVAYKFRWIDREGMRAWDEESLKPVLIYANTRFNLVSFAPTSEAVDFRFILFDQDRK